MPFLRSRFAAVCGGALLICTSARLPAAPAKAPVKAAAPAKSKVAPVVPALDLSGWNYQMADDELEARWSFRAAPTAVKAGEARVVFGWKDAANFALLRVTPAHLELWSVTGGVASRVGQSARAAGELGLQIEGERVRVLVDNQRAIEAQMKLPGNQFGEATQGGFAWDASDVQPTEAVVFRDDFMRAQGPEDAEVPSEWQVEGGWKTSGALGPKSDAALNPNPFVFRASLSAPAQRTVNEAVARAGRWFWSDYALTASVRATDNGATDNGAADNGEGAPLVATLEAFGGAGHSGLRGEIDFRAHVARLMQGDKVLAQSALFDTQAGQWHRVRLEPGPGTARLLVDGIERVAAKNVTLAQGEIALRARASGASYVDFDDVWVAPLADEKGWGEGSLPERFQKDRLMKNWASAAAAWKRGADGTWWHTGDFFGPAQVSLPVPTLAPGAGISVALNSDGKDAGTRLRIVREAGDQIAFGFDGGARAGESWVKVALAEATGHTITVKSTPRGADQVVSEAFLDGKSVGRQAGARVAGGTKIGVTPLKDGAPLGAVAPQPISLISTTFERDGRSVVGVNITPVTPKIARENALPNPWGAIVDNVETGSPAQRAGVQVGDVVVGVDGKDVTDVDSMSQAVAGAKPGAKVMLQLLRARADGSGIDWENALASTDAVLDYGFTTAPTDWRAARGRWEVAERWTCSPQWSFFSGQNSDAPLLWSRFQTQGDWTLEAYLATPMDLTRGERSPTDLNIGVGGDGRDLASGYSFGFGTDNRKHSTVWRGDSVALQQDFVLPPGTGETHQDWFYVRLEKRSVGQSVTFKWSVNGREIATYTDDHPLPDGGHLAFWSKDGGLSIARMRLWNSGLVAPRPQAWTPQPSVREISNPLGQWQPRSAGAEVSALLQNVGADQASAIQIVNPQSGGDWTTYITRSPFVPASRPTLEWDYRMGGDVKLNLYAKVEGAWHEIVWSGGASDGKKPLGSLEAVADGTWHRAKFDLLAALRAANLDGKTVEALALAAPDRNYLRAGIGGNHLGARLEVRDLSAPVLVAKAQ